MECKLNKNGIIDGLNKGVQEDYDDLLKRGLFDWYSGDCPMCGDYKDIIQKDDAGKIGCSNCLYPEEEE